MKKPYMIGGRNEVLNKGIAKIEGAGVMRVTLFERTHWAKMASAAKCAGLDSVAKKFGAAASLPVGEEIPLSVFDQLQAEWRDWLVAGFRKPVAPVAKDLITELRESLEDLLNQADLGEVDEETAPMVERAKAALKRAELAESSLLEFVRAVSNDHLVRGAVAKYEGMKWCDAGLRDLGLKARELLAMLGGSK